MVLCESTNPVKEPKCLENQVPRIRSPSEVCRWTFIVVRSCKTIVIIKIYTVKHDVWLSGSYCSCSELVRFCVGVAVSNGAVARCSRWRR